MEAVGKVYDLTLLRPKLAEEFPIALVEANPIRSLFDKLSQLEEMLCKHQFVMTELDSKLKPAQKIER